MVTINDVARKANVSIGTVDRVVHNRGRVSKKTLEKVRKVIEVLGYKPNLYARHLSMSKRYTFGVLMPLAEQDSGYWDLSVRGIERAAVTLNPYHVKIKFYHYDRFDEKSFVEQSDRLLQAMHDGILIAPVMWRPVRDFFKMIPKDVPYVLFNANVPDINATSFIGQDSYQSGIVCGKLMSMSLKQGKSIAVVLAVYDDYHIIERADGFKHFFDGNSEVKIQTYSLHKNSVKESFYEMVDEIFRDNADLGGIFVTNASTHYVAEYLKERISDRKINLIGYDLIDKNVEYLKEGWIDFLISQKAETQGYEGIYSLYREVVLQQSCPRSILMPIDVVMKENLIYYV